MRKIVGAIWQGYLAIGGILAAIMAGSYFVGAWMAAGFAGLFALPVFWMVVAIPLRALFWQRVSHTRIICRVWRFFKQRMKSVDSAERNPQLYATHEYPPNATDPRR